MASIGTESASGMTPNPAYDIYAQALKHVDALAADASEDVTAARLWALFWATTARIRYRGAPRSGFAAAFEDGCRAAEKALKQDLGEDRQKLNQGCRSPGVLSPLEVSSQFV